MNATRDIASGRLFELIAHARTTGRLPDGADLESLDARSLLLLHGAGLVGRVEMESLVEARLRNSSAKAGPLGEGSNQKRRGPGSAQIDGEAHRRPRRARRAKTSIERPGSDAIQDYMCLIASALGACPDCWGLNESCDACHGLGRPGASEPDPDTFRHFVHPALRRVALKARDAPGADETTQAASSNPHSQPRRIPHE